MAKRKQEAEIETHREAYEKPHPAINVKVYARLDFGDVPDGVAQGIWETLQEEWWADAKEIAHDSGYSGVFSEGRSGGWLAPYYQYEAGKLAKFYRWPGQGGEHGYPQWPDVSSIGERSRFLSFRRRILALLADVPDRIRLEVEAWKDAEADRVAREIEKDSGYPEA